MLTLQSKACENLKERRKNYINIARKILSVDNITTWPQEVVYDSSIKGRDDCFRSEGTHEAKQVKGLTPPMLHLPPP